MAETHEVERSEQIRRRYLKPTLEFVGSAHHVTQGGEPTKSMIRAKVLEPIYPDREPPTLGVRHRLFLNSEEHWVAGAGGLWHFHFEHHGWFLVDAETNVVQVDRLAPRLVTSRTSNNNVLPRLATRRGFLALHAAAVARNGKAIALVGPSGVGKSTVAAACASSLTLVADDSIVVSPNLAVSTYATHGRLQHDAAAFLHLGSDPSGAKTIYPLPHENGAQQPRLSHVVFPRPSSIEGPTLTPLRRRQIGPPLHRFCGWTLRIRRACLRR